MNKHRNNSSKNRGKYEKKYLTSVFICAENFFMGGMCFCFDSFKTRWGKYSEADDKEKSFLSSGIDGMNTNALSCESCIPENLKNSNDPGECDKVHRKLPQGSPHTARSVGSSQIPVPRQYSLVSPACQLPSSLHYLKQIFKFS